MNEEEVRMFLEDWFLAHSSDADAFGGEALDLLPVIVEAAMQAAVRKDGVPAVALDDPRVDTLLTTFLGRLPMMARERDPQGEELDVLGMTKEEKVPLRRVIAAALTLEDRRAVVVGELSRLKVSASSLSRETGMARSTLSQKHSMALCCAVEFMREHAEVREGRKKADPDVEVLRRRMKAKDDELREERLRGSEKDMYEVWYRKEKAVSENLRQEVQTHVENERKYADKYLRLKAIAEEHGIDVPEELDEMERLESAASMYRAMLSGGGVVS